jgi:quercetin dioxygenase-like cupin family protein
MELSNLSEYKAGWFIGNFSPAFVETKEFEVCYKEFLAGEIEAPAVQKIATEVTLVIEGKIEMNGETLKPGDLCLISPGEVAHFRALENSIVLGIKFPSIPDDKVEL